MSLLRDLHSKILTSDLPSGHLSGELLCCAVRSCHTERPVSSTLFCSVITADVESLNPGLYLVYTLQNSPNMSQRYQKKSCHAVTRGVWLSRPRCWLQRWGRCRRRRGEGLSSQELVGGMGGPLAFKLPFCPCILILHSRIALRYNITRALHSSHVSIPKLDPVNKRYVEALLLLDSSVNLSIPCPNCVSLLLNPFTELESDAVSCMLTATSLFSELLQFPELMITAPSVFLR